MSQQNSAEDLFSMLFTQKTFDQSSNQQSINLPYIIMNMVKNAANIDKNHSTFYIEIIDGREIHHKVDFDSPRTKEAAAQVGLTFKECVLR